MISKFKSLATSLYSFDGQYKNRNNDKKVDNPDVAVVDTPGRLMDDKTIQTIQGADVVVIPTRPTGGNIEAFTRTVALVKENADCSIIIVVNGVNRFTASVSFMEWLKKYRQKEALDVVISIPQSEAIVQAENYSCSVTEINKYCPATQAVNALCDKISQLAGLPVEKRVNKSKKLIEMAKTYYPNRQVAVFTQIDGKSGCVHNHLVINDVEMETYKGCDRQQYHFPSVKRWTNEITQKYTVLDKGEKNPDKLTQTEKTKIENGEYSWKEDMRERIKKALSECETSKDFFGKLQSNGISVQHKTAKRDTAKHKEFYVYELKDLSNVPEGEKAPRNTKLRSYNLGNLYDVDGVKEYFDLKQSTKVMPAAEQVQAVQMEQAEQENEPEPKRKRKKHLRFKEYLKSQGYKFYLNENGDIYKFGAGLDYKTLVEEYDEYLMTPLEEDEEPKEEEVKKEVVEKTDSVEEQEPEVPEPEEPIPEENNVQEETVPVEQMVIQPDAEAEKLREENRERAEKIALDKRKAESKLPGRIWGKGGQTKHRRLPGEPEYEDGGYDRSL